MLPDAADKGDEQGDDHHGAQREAVAERDAGRRPRRAQAREVGAGAALMASPQRCCWTGSADAAREILDRGQRADGQPAMRSGDEPAFRRCSATRIP